MSGRIFKKEQAEKVVLTRTCSKCGKKITPDSRNGSFTSFLFAANRCSCAGKPHDTASLIVESAEASAQPEEIDYPGAPQLGERYTVLEKIGEGGMGTVWKVHDNVLQQQLAVKLLRPDLVRDENSVRRFEKEASLAIELTHANIAAVFGPGRDNCGQPYILMGFVKGESLASVLAREGKLETERALEIAGQVCAGLSHAHMKGLIHRDIKPSNIIIEKTESGADLVHIVDFGIAKSVYDDVRSTQALTETEAVFGSPQYMSPEQCVGAQVSIQSDLYSLGCVLYEMLRGRPPFLSQNTVKLIISHLNEPVDFSDIPQRLQSILRSCLAKEATKRPSSADELTVMFSQLTPENIEGTNLERLKNSSKFSSTTFLAWSVSCVPVSFVAMGDSITVDQSILLLAFCLGLAAVLLLIRAGSVLEAPRLAERLELGFWVQALLILPLMLVTMQFDWLPPPITAVILANLHLLILCMAPNLNGSRLGRGEQSNVWTEFPGRRKTIHGTAQLIIGSVTASFVFFSEFFVSIAAIGGVLGLVHSGSSAIAGGLFMLGSALFLRWLSFSNRTRKFSVLLLQSLARVTVVILVGAIAATIFLKPELKLFRALNQDKIYADLYDYASATYARETGQEYKARQLELLAKILKNDSKAARTFEDLSATGTPADSVDCNLKISYWYASRKNYQRAEEFARKAFDTSLCLKEGDEPTPLKYFHGLICDHRLKTAIQSTQFKDFRNYAQGSSALALAEALLNSNRVEEAQLVCQALLDKCTLPTNTRRGVIGCIQEMIETSRSAVPSSLERKLRDLRSNFEDQR